MLPIGDVIRDLRNGQNLSQEKLARKIGVNKSTITMYENGTRVPSIKKLIALSKSIGVTTDYLLGLNNGENAYLDVTGLTPKQIESLNLIIANYRAL